MSISSDIRRKRLLYQAQHRGFKEADLLVGCFAAAHLAALDEAGLDEFERLLGFPDHDLYAWATGAADPPDGVAGPVFEMMRAFDISAVTAP